MSEVETVWGGGAAMEMERRGYGGEEGKRRAYGMASSVLEVGR